MGMKTKNMPISFRLLLEALNLDTTVTMKTKREYHVKLNNSKIPITFNAFYTGSDSGWHVVFYKGEGKDDSDYDLTSGGEQFLVKAFVLKAFKDFIKEYKPEYLTFNAKHDKKKETRANVYTKLIGREIASTYGFNLETIKTNGETEFYMTKK